jgi:hypothetical protein
MAHGGRGIYWFCLFVGGACLGFALYIFLAWPEPAPDSLESWPIPNWAYALFVTWLGVVVIGLGLAARSMSEDLEQIPD